MNRLHELKKSYVPVEYKKLTEAETQWFRDAKFGMFIHWGLYSLLGRGEWVMFNERISRSEYAKLAEKFTVEEFDAKKLARIAKDAGMKYMVLTTRHHDGFSLFDSKTSAFNSVNAAVGRDLVAEYVDACRSEGLKVGLYYSPMDWRFPGYFFPDMYFDDAIAMRDQCTEQLRELMANYGKIDLLWFDGAWLAHGGIKFGKNGWCTEEGSYRDDIFMHANYFWESEKVISMIRELQPEIMINERFCCEGDFDVRERKIGNIRTDKPWDSNDCLTISWGWRPNDRMLTLQECIHNMVRIVVRDGNYLLNVGPTGEGLVEPRQVQRLAQVGDWLEEFGDTVYSTRGGPILPGEWGGATYRGNTIYMHIIEWIEDVIVLPGLDNRIVSYESPTSENVQVTQTGSVIHISVPVKDRHPYDTIVVLKLESPVVWNGVNNEEEFAYGLGDGLNKE